jgi:thiol-disulfide isomerase/thioredoxin
VGRVRAGTRIVALLLGLGSLAGAGALAGCSTGAGADAAQGGGSRYVQGDGKTITYARDRRSAAPEMSGETLDGGTFSLAAQRGKVVVINFWASWCPPCRSEAAALEATYQSVKDSGVVFVGVDSRDSKDQATAFLVDRATYPNLFDPAGRVALQFTDVPPSTLPATLIVDRSGKVAVAIRAPVRQDDLTRLVRSVAAEQT